MDNSNRDIISNGIDIVAISKIEEILKKNIKYRFLNKIFVEEEINYFDKVHFRSETIAGYFAAKEATMKVLGEGIGKISFKDIIILKNESNKPIIKLKDSAEEYATSLGINEVLLSISHENDYAIAFTIGIK